MRYWFKMLWLIYTGTLYLVYGIYIRYVAFLCGRHDRVGYDTYEVEVTPLTLNTCTALKNMLNSNRAVHVPRVLGVCMSTRSYKPDQLHNKCYHWWCENSTRLLALHCSNYACDTHVGDRNNTNVTIHTATTWVTGKNIQTCSTAVPPIYRVPGITIPCTRYNSPLLILRPFIVRHFFRFRKGPFLPLLFVTSCLNFLVRV